MSEDKGIRKEGIGFPSRFRTGDAMVFRPLTAGMLTEAEAAARLGIHELTLVRWAEYAIIKRAAHNQHPYLYELLDSDLPGKHSVDGNKKAEGTKQSDPLEGGVV